MNLLVLRFLTMNTADERRDELRMLIAAAAAARRISGELDDVIVEGGRRRSTVSDSVCSGRYVMALNGGTPATTSSKPMVSGGQSLTNPPASTSWRRKRPRYQVYTSVQTIM